MTKIGQGSFLGILSNGVSVGCWCLTTTTIPKAFRIFSDSFHQVFVSQNPSQSCANSPVGHGDVLITTRHQSLEQLGTVIEVPPMPTDEAVKLLLRGYSETNIDPYKSQ